MNKVILVGRLTKDPETRSTSNNLDVCRFSLAISRHTAQGEATDYIDCVAWRNMATNLEKYCKKGSLISVEGRLNNRSYESEDGTKRKITEVICDSIEFLGSSRSTKEQTEEAQETNDAFEEFAQDTDIDDLPF